MSTSALVGSASLDPDGFARIVASAASTHSVCLVVLDGWGLAEAGPDGAVALADTPVFDELWERRTALTAWGPAVGLPEGQMGNSEVGHMNLGAGAVVKKQDLLRIDESIEDGSFFENEALRADLQERAPACSGSSQRAACTRAWTTCARSSSWPGGRRRGRRAARSPTGATRCHLRGGLRSGGRKLGRLANRDRHRALPRDGPRPPLGPHEARMGRDRAGAGRAQGRDRRGRRARNLRSRRDRRVHRADAGRRRGAGRDGDSVIFFGFRPTAPASSRARSARPTSPSSIASGPPRSG